VLQPADVHDRKVLEVGAMNVNGSLRSVAEPMGPALYVGVDLGHNTQDGSGGMPAGLDWVALVRESKPMVAAVNGAAVGIGLTMLLPFDVILTSWRPPCNWPAR